MRMHCSFENELAEQRSLVELTQKDFLGLVCPVIDCQPSRGLRDEKEDRQAHETHDPGVPV